MFVYGRYVLDRVFGFPPARRVRIFSAAPHTTQFFREQFGLSEEFSMEIVDELPNRSINVDFWGILPSSSEPVSFDAAHPISKNLYKVSSTLSIADSVRFIDIATIYPWISVTPELSHLVEVVKKSFKEDPEPAELSALKFSERTLSEILESVKGGLPNR